MAPMIKEGVFQAARKNWHAHGPDTCLLNCFTETCHEVSTVERVLLQAAAQL